MNSNASKDIEYILSKLKRISPDIHTNIFGSYNHNSSSNDNDIIGKRRETLISHCNEALRILKTKRVNLSKKEKPIIRVVLVIDYLVRNVRNDNSGMYFRSSIPMDKLMEIVGSRSIRKKDLEEMQQLLCSYLENTIIAKNIAKQNARNFRKRTSNGTAATNNAAAAIEVAISPTGLIRDLCIKLGPLIPDAEFVVQYATKLFDALANNVSNKKSRSSNNVRQREQEFLRQDMSRFLECYEGACFYLAVKESEGANYNDVLKKKASAKITAKNQQKREDVKKKNSDAAGRREDVPNNNGNGDQEDGQEDEDDTDDDRPMNEMDVVMAACLSERTFETVLAYVKKFALDIVISVDDTKDQKKPAKKKGRKKDTRSDNGFGGRSVIMESNVNKGESMRRSGSNVEFERWKKSVLNATMANKMEEYEDNSMTREEVMKRIAEDAVQEMQKSS